MMGFGTHETIRSTWLSSSCDTHFIKLSVERYIIYLDICGEFKIHVFQNASSNKTEDCSGLSISLHS